MSARGPMPRANPLGLALFAAYSACYAAFVGVAAFGTFSAGSPSGGLAASAPRGPTWGVVGGFGLIVGAIVLSVLYAVLARGSTRE